MERPVALKLRTANATEVHQVSFDPAAVGQFRTISGKEVPAIVVTQRAALLAPMSAAMIDAADVLAISDGDWANAILVVLPENKKTEKGALAIEQPRQSADGGDAKFLEQVQRTASNLADLAAQTIAAIRGAGVDGELVEGGGGRWVNRPLNTFTLKAQPRVGNLQFTLYGNPDSYNADGFLLKDQNSYSRGWVRKQDDVGRLAELVRVSHARRTR
jgi:hypothetical protein